MARSAHSTLTAPDRFERAARRRRRPKTRRENTRQAVVAAALKDGGQR